MARTTLLDKLKGNKEVADAIEETAEVEETSAEETEKQEAPKKQAKPVTSGKTRFTPAD